MPDAPAQPSRQAEYAARKSAAARDVSRPLRRGDPGLHAACRGDFRRFCESYMPMAFPLAWSADHLRVIAKIEGAVLRGELCAIAMPRGSGKTSLCEAASIWSILYGHRRFVTVIGSDEPSAAAMLDSIVTEIETNELLARDFPEAVLPVLALEGIHQRAGGQSWNGERTRMEWTATRVVFPTVRARSEDHEMGTKAGELYPTSGTILDVAGITGRLRGRKHKLATGETIRPDLVLVDDPQTDESARSPSQVANRLKTLNGAVLGLAGPGKKIAGLCTVTVISPGDMADQLLDPMRYPQWQGERTKLLYEEPKAKGLWEQYAQLRLEGLRDGSGLKIATEFYRENQSKMDEGSKIAWPERYNPDEISALQHAMNLKLQDEAAFQSEYQNEPLPPEDQTTGDLVRDEIMARITRLPRLVARPQITRVTAGIDVQKKILYWSLCGWADDLGGDVLDYGGWPDQPRQYFTLRSVRKTLASTLPGVTIEAQIMQGIESLVDYLVSRVIKTEDGTRLAIGRILVDSGNWTEAVYEACRVSKHAGIIMPSKGIGIRASHIPLNEKPRKRGDRTGEGWRIPVKPPTRGAPKLALLDANHWKSRLAHGLVTSPEDPGSIMLAGERDDEHEMIADHFTAEYRVPTTGRGREVDEWKEKPGKPDNHLLDTTYMAMAAASIEGAGVIQPRTRRAKAAPVSFSELQRQRREERRGGR